MKQIVILSGKGGTGKTTVTAALVHLASQDSSSIAVDADVDAPNLDILLRSRPVEGTPFEAGKRAHIDPEHCTRCGVCAEACRFDAVLHHNGEYQVDSVACEGCGACFFACPSQTIRLESSLAGHWYRSQTRFGELFHARLATGAENSGKMVSLLRQEALSAAHENDAEWVFIDGAPGIGCPVIAAVTGTDCALVVSEPTVSGLHDLERIVEICEHFGVPTAVCVNKADINPAKTDQIAAFCEQNGIRLLARIPYDQVVIAAMQRGLAVTELDRNAVSDALGALWAALREL